MKTLIPGLMVLCGFAGCVVEESSDKPLSSAEQRICGATACGQPDNSNAYLDCIDFHCGGTSGGDGGGGGGDGGGGDGVPWPGGEECAVRSFSSEVCFETDQEAETCTVVVSTVFYSPCYSTSYMYTSFSGDCLTLSSQGHNCSSL